MVIDNIGKKITKIHAEKKGVKGRKKAVAKETAKRDEVIELPRKKLDKIKDKSLATPRTAQSRKPTREEIARRAYDIWTGQGSPDGVEIENWLTAEQELLRENGW